MAAQMPRQTPKSHTTMHGFIFPFYLWSSFLLINSLGGKCDDSQVLELLPCQWDPPWEVNGTSCLMEFQAPWFSLAQPHGSLHLRSELEETRLISWSLSLYTFSSFLLPFFLPLFTHPSLLLVFCLPNKNITSIAIIKVPVDMQDKLRVRTKLICSKEQRGPCFDSVMLRGFLIMRGQMPVFPVLPIRQPFTLKIFKWWLKHGGKKLTFATNFVEKKFLNY